MMPHNDRNRQAHQANERPDASEPLFRPVRMVAYFDLDRLDLGWGVGLFCSAWLRVNLGAGLNS